MSDNRVTTLFSHELAWVNGKWKLNFNLLNTSETTTVNRFQFGQRSEPEGCLQCMSEWQFAYRSPHDNSLLRAQYPGDPGLCMNLMAGDDLVLPQTSFCFLTEIDQFYAPFLFLITDYSKRNRTFGIFVGQNALEFNTHKSWSLVLT